MIIYRKIVGLLFIISSLTIIDAQPLQNRILIASSYDGLNWQKLNVIATDSGDVPDAVIGPSGAVYFFHQGLITPYIDGFKVGISQNGINNWQFYQVEIPGTGSWQGRPCDPDVIVYGDTFRLYFTGDPINDGRPETYSAISFDGINFTRENGVRFEVPGSPVLDPSLLWTGETLQYFAGGAPLGQNWHAHSIDGLTFIQQPNFSISNLMMANGLRTISGNYRFYGFNNIPNTGIRSLYSVDGGNWTVEPGYRLQVDTTNVLEYLYVKDPAIVFKDSIYIMYYVTRKRLMAIDESRFNDAVPYRQTLNVSANLCRGILHLRLQTTTETQPYEIRIYDALGKIIGKLKIEKTHNNAPLQLNLQDLPDRIYFISFQPSQTENIHKIVFIK